MNYHQAVSAMMIQMNQLAGQDLVPNEVIMDRDTYRCLQDWAMENNYASPGVVAEFSRLMDCRILLDPVQHNYIEVRGCKRLVNTEAA